MWNVRHVNDGNIFFIIVWRFALLGVNDGSRSTCLILGWLDLVATAVTSCVHYCWGEIVLEPVIDRAL